MERLQYVINGKAYDQINDVPSRNINVVQHLRFNLFDRLPFATLLQGECTLQIDYEAVSFWSSFGAGNGVLSRSEALNALWSAGLWSDAPTVDVQGASDITSQVVNQQQAMILTQMYLHPLPTEERTRLQDLIAQDVDGFFQEISQRSDDAPFRAVTVSNDGGRWNFDVHQSMTLAVTYRDDPNAKVRIEMSRRVVWKEDSTVVHTDSESEINGGNRLTAAEVTDLQTAASSIMSGDFGRTSSSNGCCVGFPVAMIVLAIVTFLLIECTS